MIYKKDSLDVTINEKMRGGEGSVVIEHLLDKDALYQKGRLCARVTLKPGCSIGFHHHENEMEMYYIIEGSAAYDDNGTQTRLATGDVAYTPDGCGHSIINDQASDLIMLALIIGV